MARKVVAPSGVEWKVGRQWAPWRVSVRRRDADLGDGGVEGGPDWGDWFDLDDAGVIFTSLVILVLGALLLLVVWPVMAIAIEIVVIGLGVLVSALGRLVLRRPWTVVATVRGHRDHGYEWKVRGWRASGELIDTVADALENRQALPPHAMRFGFPPAPLPEPSR